jgi:hypothetical protein
MIYRIEPYVGVGPIRLGMTREEVQGMLVAPREPAMHRGSALPGDFFPTLWLFVDYRAPGVCEFVEFARDSPCSPTLYGQEFLGQPYRSARAWFEAHDPGLETHGAGLISRQFGVALYASAAEKAPDEPIEAVAVFEQDYYEHQAAF